MEQGEIILYQPNDSLRLEVRLDGDNVWLIIILIWLYLLVFE